MGLLTLVWSKIIGMGVVINGCAHSGCRNLKLAVSRKEINRINWFLVLWYKIQESLKLVCPSIRQFSIFLRNDILFFSDFGTMVNNWNIQKLTEPCFSRKIHFCPDLGEKGQNGHMAPKQGFLKFLKDFVISFSWK